jgi:ribonuclease HI
VQDQETMMTTGRNEALNNRQPSWIPPPDGVIKVNWDASMNVAKNWVGLGIIARDSKGLYMGARSITLKAKTDPKMVETMATLEAIQFSKEAGFWDFIFEGDATQVVKEIKSDMQYFSKTGHFLESIHQEMQHFRSISFQNIPCDCNMAAHTLAKEASCNNIDLCWLEDTPLSVSNIVFREQPCPYDPLGSILMYCFLEMK